MMIRALLLTALCLALAGLAVLIGFRSYIIYKADQHAEEVYAGTSVSSAPAISLYATQRLYQMFRHETYADHPILSRLRPYISNARLPDFIRIPTGATETVMMEGWCDDAGRALTYILSKRNVESRQFNFVGPSNAHSAVIAQFDKPALLDPYYGYHTITQNGVVPPEEAAAKHALIPIDEKSNRAFYAHFDKLSMGAQGDEMTITAALPAKKVTLGSIDGKTDDARDDMMKNDMTPMWNYIGHKYDRGWTRELIADEAMQVDIILTRPANENVLRTLTPAPVVNGTKLTWNLLKGDKIISKDGLAGISWTRLKSYIDIDQMLITPTGEQP